MTMTAMVMMEMMAKQQLHGHTGHMWQRDTGSLFSVLCCFVFCFLSFLKRPNTIYVTTKRNTRWREGKTGGAAINGLFPELHSEAIEAK